jgi:hypothetical protein
LFTAQNFSPKDAANATKSISTDGVVEIVFDKLLARVAGSEAFTGLKQTQLSPL